MENVSSVKVDALERALDILEVFGDGRTSVSLKELAAETGLYKSRILRLSASLVDRGYLRRDDEGRYRLGPTTWRLGTLYRRGFELSDHIRPVLADIVADINESAAFYVRDGDARVCLFRRESTHSIRHHVDEGERLPLELGVPGRVLCAFEGKKGDLYDRIRRDGFMDALGERDSDTAAVAVPVQTAEGQLVGVLSVAGLNSRFNPDERKRAVQALQKGRQVLEAKLMGEIS